MRLSWVYCLWIEEKKKEPEAYGKGWEKKIKTDKTRFYYSYFFCVRKYFLKNIFKNSTKYIITLFSVSNENERKNKTKQLTIMIYGRYYPIPMSFH